MTNLLLLGGCCLLFTLRSQVWIDVESSVYRRDFMVLPVIDIYNGGMPILELYWPWAHLVLQILANFPLFAYFRCFLLQFMFGFRFIHIFQINHSSSEFRLSRISVGVWFWEVGHLSLRPNLLAAFSHAIDYQPALMMLTLMSMSNARKDYLKSTSDQLCYLLIFFHPVNCPILFLLESLGWSTPLLSSKDFKF